MEAWAEAENWSGKTKPPRDESTRTEEVTKSLKINQDLRLVSHFSDFVRQAARCGRNPRVFNLGAVQAGRPTALICISVAVAN